MTYTMSSDQAIEQLQLIDQILSDGQLSAGEKIDRLQILRFPVQYVQYLTNSSKAVINFQSATNHKATNKSTAANNNPAPRETKTQRRRRHRRTSKLSKSIAETDFELLTRSDTLRQTRCNERGGIERHILGYPLPPTGTMATSTHNAMAPRLEYEDTAPAWDEAPVLIDPSMHPSRYAYLQKILDERPVVNAGLQQDKRNDGQQNLDFQLPNIKREELDSGIIEEEENQERTIEEGEIIEEDGDGGSDAAPFPGRFSAMLGLTTNGMMTSMSDLVPMR